MSEDKWIAGCRRILKDLKERASRKDRDRLDLVKSIRYSMRALNRSLMGWWQWVNSPEMMANFTREELEDMDRTLNNHVTSFIEYDIKVTRVGSRFRKKEEVERRGVEGLVV